MYEGDWLGRWHQIGDKKGKRHGDGRITFFDNEDGSAGIADPGDFLDGAWAGNGVEPDVLDGCDKLLEVVRLVGEHPRVKEWNAAHPAEWFG